MSSSDRFGLLHRLQWYIGVHVQVHVNAPETDVIIGTLTAVDEDGCVVRGDRFDYGARKMVDYFVPLTSIRYVMADDEKDSADEGSA